MSSVNDSPALDSQPPLAPTRVRLRTNRCVKNVKWHKKQDELLMKMMVNNERPNYSKMAENFPGKTGQQVAERWDKVLNPALVKGSWTRQEDETIIKYVQENGTKNWRHLCDLLPGRIGKQCRERWRNHLDPNINHSPWTAEEDATLIHLHKQFGNHWVKISSMMINRSDNAIKNRWNSTLKKLKGVYDDVQIPKPILTEMDSPIQSPCSTPRVCSVLDTAFAYPSPTLGIISPKLRGKIIPETTPLEDDASKRPVSLADNRTLLLELISS